MKNNFDPIYSVIKPLDDGKTPPGEIVNHTTIDVRGREEHETILRDPASCEERGLDVHFELMVYLKRWGG